MTAKETKEAQAGDADHKQRDNDNESSPQAKKSDQTFPSEVLRPFIRDESPARIGEAEKVKVLALLKGVRDEMNQSVKKGVKVRDQADMFISRYNFFLERASRLFPNSDFAEIFQPLETGAAGLEKIRLELTLMIAYIQNDILDIIEQSERLKEKNKWLQERIREFEIKIAGIQAIK